MKIISPKLNVKLNHMLGDLCNSKFVSSKQLRRKLIKSFRKIRRYYKSILSYNRLEPQDKWIFENYYSMERVYKETYHTLENEHFLASNNQNMPDLLMFLMEAISYEKFELDENIVVELIDIFEKKRYLHNFEYDFLNLFIKVSVIMLISQAIKFGLNATHTERISRLIKLLTSVNLIDFANINHSKNKLEAVLLNDPTEIYSKQNDKTRSLYRYKVAKAAFYENCDELTLAKKLIKQSALEKKHIGFYIYEHYEKAKPKNPIAKYHVKLCFFLATVLSFLVTAIVKNIFLLPLLYPLMYELVRPIVEKMCLKGSEVTYPPRLELFDTVPKDMQTLVVISTLLPSSNELDGLYDKLTKMLLQNKDGAIGFCLLCDLKSAKEKYLKDDENQIYAVKSIIKQLNADWDNRFLLVVRNRSYSKTQDEYTGYERKRGAITDLINLISGKEIALAELYGNTECLCNTKYILTLDYDTRLKINIISKLVSIACHPLNKPVIDAQKGIVTSGYGIISPRMTLDLKSSQKTYFAMIFGGIGGTTTYDASCSEFYQDLYNRAIFSGKGLIDVSAYAKLMPKLFQEETLLSHDIVEGGFLKVLYASDDELIESFPSDGISYFKRLNRWVRGDFQNAEFITSIVSLYKGKCKNPLNKVVRFQLFDNLRRAVTPIFAVLCILIATFVDGKSRTFLISAAILGTVSPYLHSFINLIVSGSVSAFTTRFYSNIFPRWIELFYSATGSFLLLPQYAYFSLDASIKGIYRRFFSRKKMLEWSTASQVESKKNSTLGIILFYISQFVVGVFLLIFGSLPLKTIGLLFIIAVPLLLILKKSPIKKEKVSEPISSYLTANLKKMLFYYNDFAGEKDNFLPPDNMQKTPVYRVAHRTSPTNIGLMLLSYLTARDFNLFDSNKLYTIIEATISTIERMEKYHGNLYNWYDTKTLKMLTPGFVSTVDSGNFLCCLVTLKEGLKEFVGEQKEIGNLILRIEAIIDATDLSKFYDRRKHLFSIGYDVNHQILSNSHYDMLMSEARMTSYFAIAKGQVPVKHWSALSRAMSRTLFHSGPISWTGTMFEYFMPELMLHCISGSIGYEALNYCIACQIKRAQKNDVPFGISESAIYAFDDYLNYQYSPNGVQKIAIKRGMDDELVISPYSSYLTLPFALTKSYDNLLRLDGILAIGEYGHYEAIDYTKTRVDNKCAVIKSYMAHHVGMSIVAINNALNNNIMQKRFLRDRQMDRATELLNERNSVGEIVFEDLFKRKTKKRNTKKPDISEYVGELFPQQPRVKILTNTDISCVLTDSGASFIRSNQTDIVRRPNDLLRNPKGSFCYLKFGDNIFSTTFAPSYDENVNYETAFSQSSVEYFARTENVKVKTEVRLHSILPCEQREIVIENRSRGSVDATLLFYLEPCLAKEEDDFAHLAFSKLFINVSRDGESNTIIAKRKKRGSEELYYMAVGFRDNVNFDFEANRENLFERTNISSIKPSAFTDEYISNSGVPDPCIAIRTTLKFSKNETKSIYLLTSVSTSKSDAIANILAMREQEPIESEMSATSRLLHSSLEHRIGQTILPQILFNKRDSSNNLNAISNNRLNTQSLWKLAISGDFPIVLVDIFSYTEFERVEVYLKCHSLFKLSFIEFDLVFLSDGSPQIEEMVRKVISEYE
ncbi:MAG: glucoamylase family protein, partial [Oscillospiraceae bacterium]